MESEDFGSESDTNDWEFQEDDSDQSEIQSLFSSRRFTSIDEAIQYDSQEFNFDLRQFRRQASHKCTHRHSSTLMRGTVCPLQAEENHKRL